MDAPHFPIDVLKDAWNGASYSELAATYGEETESRLREHRVFECRECFPKPWPPTFTSH